MSADPDPDHDTRHAVERWFLARGTPHLIEGYSASEDVLTRALPVLTFVFLAELAAVLNTEWTWWQNVLAAGGGFVLLVGIWVGVNWARGAALLSRPARVGVVEVGTFLLGPPLVPLAIGGQLGSAAGVLTLNVVLLAVIYAATSYALIPLTRWAGAKVVKELGSIAPLLGRALPLLLLITFVLFINAEMWQVANGLDGPALVGSILLLFGIGLAFLLVRLPRELPRLARFDSAADLVQAVHDTPAEDLARVLESTGRDLATPAPLGKRQRGNLLLVALVSQGVPVAATTLVLGTFFTALGLLIAPAGVVEAWIGEPPRVLLHVEMLDRPIELTAELLTVASFLAAFSGLYFTVVLVTDATFRGEFLDEILAEVRQALAVRVAYATANAPAGGVTAETEPPVRDQGLHSG